MLQLKKRRMHRNETASQQHRQGTHNTLWAFLFLLRLILPPSFLSIHHHFHSTFQSNQPLETWNAKKEIKQFARCPHSSQYEQHKNIRSTPETGKRYTHIHTESVFVHSLIEYISFHLQKMERRTNRTKRECQCTYVRDCMRCKPY